MYKNKKILLIFFVCLFYLGNSSQLKADPVPYDTARKIALNWYRFFAPVNQKTGSVSSYFVTETKGKITLYTFHFSTGGFIIVSAEDLTDPVLAYSFSSEIQKNLSNISIKSWQENFSNGIIEIAKNKSGGYERNIKWDEILANDFSRYQKKFFNEVKPLISTKWGQANGWNKFCPIDPAGYNGHAPVGCVAVAVAQVIKKWEHPDFGIGSKDYYSDRYGNISADFQNTNYLYENMGDKIPDDYNALLLFHCGVALDMIYGPEFSSCDTYSKPIIALTEYFGYNRGMVYRKRSDYSRENWDEMVKNELNNGRPLIYRGQDNATKGGHAFNVDGYQNGFFHINWGWDGKGNGYFLLEMPVTGSYEFSRNQGAVFGTYPLGHIIFNRPEQLTLTGMVKKIKLQWNSPIQNMQKYYNIFRDGKLINTTSDNYYYDFEVEDNKNYTYYVTAVYEGINNGESSSSNQQTMHTSIPNQLPYFEDFDGNISDWYIKNYKKPWVCKTSASTKYMLCRPNVEEITFLNGSKLNNLLVSPYLDLSSYSSVGVSFDYYLKYLKNNHNFSLYYRNSEDSDWVLLWSSEFTDIDNNCNWTNASLILPKVTLTNNVRFGFSYDSGISEINFLEFATVYGDNFSGVGLDNFKIVDNGSYPVPQNIFAYADNNSIQLKYSNPDELSDCSYKIYRNGLLIDIIKEKSYTDHNVLAGNHYVYQIIAAYDSIESLASDKIDIVPWNIYGIPYNANFDENNKGWSNITGPVNWTIGNYGNSENYSSKTGNFFVSADEERLKFPVNNMLVSPGLNLMNKYPLLLSFEYILNKTRRNDVLEMFYRTKNDNDWIKICEFDATGGWDSWKREFIELPDDIKSEYSQIAFKFKANGKSYSGIDNIIIDRYKKNTSPTNLKYSAGSSNISLNWDIPEDYELDHYNVYRNDTLISQAESNNYFDHSSSWDILNIYRVTSVHNEGDFIESKPSEPVFVYVGIPYKQEFRYGSNGWFIKGKKSRFNMKLPYTDQHENLINETGYVYYGMGLDNTGPKDRIISPPFDLTGKDSLSLLFDYSFVSNNPENKLSIEYREYPHGNWENISDLDIVENLKIYKSTLIRIPKKAHGGIIQFSFLNTVVDQNQPGLVRLDNFEIGKYNMTDIGINLSSEFDNKNVYLEWETRGNNIYKYFNIYRNLKLVGTSISNLFIDSTFHLDKTYYYRIRGVSNDMTESLPSNQEIINPDPQFTIPYKQTFNRSNNIQWNSDGILWDYHRNNTLKVNTENQTAYFGYTNTDAQNIDTESWLLSPVYLSGNETDVCMNLDYIFKNYNIQGEQNLGIYYRTDSREPWILIQNLERTSSSTHWRNINIDLADIFNKGSFQLGIRIRRQTTSSGLMIVGIDNIRIFSKLGLVPPDNFNIESNINFASLSWSAPAGRKPMKYSIYRNDSLIHETKSLYYSDYEIPDHKNIIYQITAYYDDGFLGESLPVVKELINYNYQPPYSINFEDGFDEWDISGNFIGWKWSKRTLSETNNYIFTELPSIPSEDIVRTNYFSLDFPGTLSISFDYNFVGTGDQQFQLMFKNESDSGWTILNDLPFTNVSETEEFVAYNFPLPDEVCRENIRFAFLYRNNSFNSGSAAIDNFKILGTKGVYKPINLEYFINNQLVGLNWEEPEERKPNYYNIFRNDSLIAISNEPYFYDSNVKNGNEYYYKTTALFTGINAGESYPTNEVRVIPLPYLDIPYYEDFEKPVDSWIFSGGSVAFNMMDKNQISESYENNSVYVGIKTKVTTETFMISPIYDLLDRNNVYLSFDYLFKNYYTFNELDIMYRFSVDENWTSLVELEPTGYNWKNFEYYIPETLLKDSMQFAVRFINKHKSAKFSASAIDNVGLFEKTEDIPPSKNDISVNVYPNPSNGNFNIDLYSDKDSKFIISIITKEGREVYYKTFENHGFKTNMNLDLKRLNKGMYFVRINSDGNIINKKIIIQ